MRFFPGPAMARLADGSVMPIGQAQQSGYRERIPGYGEKAFSALPVTGTRGYIPLKIVDRRAVGNDRLPQTSNGHYLPTPTDSVMGTISGGNMPDHIIKQSNAWTGHIQDVNNAIPLTNWISNFFSLPNPFRRVS